MRAGSAAHGACAVYVCAYGPCTAVTTNGVHGYIRGADTNIQRRT